MSILCLDVGSKRIGVAKSDDLGLAAHAVTVIERGKRDADMAHIMELCHEYEIDRIVVGLPLDEEGGFGVSANKVLRFVEALKNALALRGMELEVETWDERYSTAQAEEVLIGADVSRKKRRRVIDKLAAVMILTDYMEFKA